MAATNSLPGSTGRLAGPQRQRGIAAIFAAISLVTLLSAVGLAIDVGRLYYANRDLQRLSDLAAIDGARVQSQCLGSAGVAEVTAEVEASLKRNRMPAGTTVVTRLGRRVEEGEDGLQFFSPAAPGKAPDSVQVTLSRSNPARILPLFAGDDSRTLTTRSAAASSGGASAVFRSQPSGRETSAGLTPDFYNNVLNARIGAGGGSSFTDAVNTTVTVGEFSLDSSAVGSQLPDLTVPTPVQGLLSQIEALLNSTGDGAAAQLVSSYSAAIAVARPGASVIPAEVLGLPAQGTYDGATASVGDVLDAITGAVSDGDVIQLPKLCALLPLDQLPTAQLLPALCDSSVSASLPQPSRPGSTSASTQLASVSTSDTDSARTGGGLVQVRLRLVNPITGQPIEVPFKIAVTSGKVDAVLESCQRVGQPQNVASVTASGVTSTFTLGQSDRFDASFGSPNVDIGRVLDDVAPARIITASVRDLLTGAGLGAVANNPLFAGVVGQTVGISAYIAPISLGDDRSETFCMQGPPFGVTERCDGSPSAVGGISSADVAARLPEALSQVQISVQLPQGLPLALNTVLQPVIDNLTRTVSASLKDALGLISLQIKPILASVNLTAGQSYVALESAGATAPKIYAR